MTRSTPKTQAIDEITCPDIPSVQLPRALQIVGIALSQSRDGFQEVWQYEQEHQIGLQAAKLLWTAVSKTGKPIGKLAVVAISTAYRGLTGTTARSFVKAQWSRFQDKGV
ncbi:MAG: hypothetical protein AAFW84_26620 [Cyanobacteria bacterium J06635_15]